MNAPAFSSAPRPPAPRQPLSRNAVIALAVVGLHVGFIWALQSGLLMRAAEIVVPAEVLAQFIDPPAPKVEPVPPTPPTPTVQKKAVAKAPVQPAPQPLAITDPTPSPNAPTGVVTPPLPPAPVAVAPSRHPHRRGAIALQRRRLPAEPETALPAHQQAPGRTGQGDRARAHWHRRPGAKKVEIADPADLTGWTRQPLPPSMSWRYVPGKRGGVPEEMWFDVPINFVLE
jgi:protein TonB